MCKKRKKERRKTLLQICVLNEYKNLKNTIIFIAPYLVAEVAHSFPLVPMSIQTQENINLGFKCRFYRPTAPI